MSASVTVRDRSRPDSLSKQASEASALTSHGWPCVRSQTNLSDLGENACPVSFTCCPSKLATSAREKSAKRSVFALMLNGLPPEASS